MNGLSQATYSLLDTNAFLYFINHDSRLSERAKKLIESEIGLLISSVSLWEIAIKVSINKLDLPDSFGNFIPSQIQQNDIEVLSINLQHLDKVSSLPFHHKDPFDRLIIAQSLIENLSVISSDVIFDSYGTERIW